MAAVSDTNMDDTYLHEKCDMKYSYHPTWERPGDYWLLDTDHPRKCLI